jgi:N-acetylneuraminate synthase
MINNNEVFDELFVLELANNHWGKVERGLKIIEQFGLVVRFNGVRAAIKLQFRDVDNFIHKDYRDRNDIRYIKKTLDTKMSKDNYATLVEAVRKNGCITMATPFDEASVALCGELGVEMIKIASSDVNDWPLIEAIAKLRKPTIVSTGGTTLKDLDNIVTFFANRNIPLAINHCVSIYPSEDNELEINQVDYLKKRYPNNVIGFSSHEYHSLDYSIMLAYAKGARTFERHIDINEGGIPVSPYCSLPEQTDKWFKAFIKAKEMCGGSGLVKRVPPEKEIKYLDALVRGVYAKRDLPKGHKFRHATLADDVYLAVPLLKGQISCREISENEELLSDIRKDSPILIDDIDSPYSQNIDLKAMIYNRGM